MTLEEKLDYVATKRGLAGDEAAKGLAWDFGVELLNEAINRASMQDEGRDAMLKAMQDLVDYATHKKFSRLR